jgi:hypothetical protein
MLVLIIASKNSFGSLRNDQPYDELNVKTARNASTGITYSLKPQLP